MGSCLDSKENYKLVPDVILCTEKVYITLNDSLIGVKMMTRTSKAYVSSFSLQTKLLMSSFTRISLYYVAFFGIHVFSMMLDTLLATSNHRQGRNV